MNKPPLFIYNKHFYNKRNPEIKKRADLPRGQTQNVEATALPAKPQRLNSKLISAVDQKIAAVLKANCWTALDVTECLAWSDFKTECCLCELVAKVLVAYIRDFLAC